LILNALITLITIAGILYGFYHAWPWWKPYSPYLISGQFYLIAAAAALINIFPSASIGRALHTGRLWFHHYAYGFFVLIISGFYMIVFTSVSLVSFIFVDTSSMAINTGRLFGLIGMTLVLDDLPDVSKRIESGLNKLKSQAYRARKAVHVAQLATGLITFYICVAMVLWGFVHSNENISLLLTSGTLLITSITSFACVKRKAWLKITPPQTNEH
jgi:hypothetical protein